MSKLPITGGCLCGAVRYEAAAEPQETGYCHCRMCQQLAGGTMTVWATFDRKALRYTAGEPAVYRSSDIAQREFCRRCGSQLAYRMIDDNSELTINIGSLDDPERFPPQMHIWCDSQVSWFDTKDDLPRYPRDEPN